MSEETIELDMEDFKVLNVKVFRRNMEMLVSWGDVRIECFAKVSTDGQLQPITMRKEGATYDGIVLSFEDVKLLSYKVQEFLNGGWMQ